jgi:hypothetical protein
VVWDEYRFRVEGLSSPVRRPPIAYGWMFAATTQAAPLGNGTRGWCAMGKSGPAAKPTKLRVLHGDRADRINADEPEPPEDKSVVLTGLLLTAGRSGSVSRPVWKSAEY